MNSDDQAALDKEFQALDNEVNRIASKTFFAGTIILDKTGGASGTFKYPGWCLSE